MLNSVELKDKQAVLIKRCKEIVDLCKKEVREMTDEEAKEFKDAKEEIKQCKEELKALEEKLARYDEELPDDEEPEKDPDEEPEKDPDEEDEDKDKSKENQEDKNKRNITMKKQKFNLLKELRSAYETGKKVNLAEIRANTVTADGEDVVQTDIFNIWEPLRAKNVLVEAGAQFISGIKNNVQIPLMGAVSVNWAGETAAAEDGSGAFSHKTLSPKRITAKYPISLELLAQDSIGVENAVRNDIIKAVNAKIEETLLGDAAGDTTKPAGLFNGKTSTHVSAFKDITALEAEVESANVYGECKYVMSPKAKADLRSMPKSTKSTQLVMEAGAVDGTPVLATTHVKDNNFIYGDFSNLVIATWDNVTIDVVRDVASVGNGQVTIVVNAFMDAALVRDKALVYGTTAAE